VAQDAVGGFGLISQRPGHHAPRRISPHSDARNGELLLTVTCRFICVCGGDGEILTLDAGLSPYTPQSVHLIFWQIMISDSCNHFSAIFSSSVMRKHTNKSKKYVCGMYMLMAGWL